MERGREKEREEGRDGGREGGQEGWRERVRERERERESQTILVHVQLLKHKPQLLLLLSAVLEELSEVHEPIVVTVSLLHNFLWWCGR